MPVVGNTKPKTPFISYEGNVNNLLIGALIGSVILLFAAAYVEIKRKTSILRKNRPTEQFEEAMSEKIKQFKPKKVKKKESEEFQSAYVSPEAAKEHERMQKEARKQTAPSESAKSAKASLPPAPVSAPSLIRANRRIGGAKKSFFDIFKKSKHHDPLSDIDFSKEASNIPSPKKPNLIRGSVQPAINTWKTIKLERKLDPNSLKVISKDDSFGPGDYFNLISLASLPEPIDAKLAITTPREMGFVEPAPYEDILKRALELGLKLCPPTVGPELRQKYADQPAGESLLIAMEPIPSAEEAPYIFSLDNESGNSILSAVKGGAEKIFPLDQKFVFLR